MVHITKGNSKLGPMILNVSLPPLETCVKNVPCAEKCYARKAYRMYPNVRANWDENLRMYRESPGAYFGQIMARLSQGKKSPAYFRWHAAGEVVDDRYFEGIVNVARHFPGTRFLLYTRYPFENVMPKGEIPRNLSIVKSYWLGFDRPYDPEYPGFMVIERDESTRFMEELVADGMMHTVIPCKGSCHECHACWHLTPGDLVTNHIH